MKHENAEPDQPIERGTTGPPIKLILLFVAVAALATFFFQNGDDAPVEFLWIDASWPLWAVIGVSVGLGVLIDRLVIWQWRRRANG